MKVGIVCDDYKVEKFKEKLYAAKLLYTVSVFNKEHKLTGIYLFIEFHQLEIVYDICKDCEIKFDHLKNKN